jgi:sulfoxide reductase heme-binding subunit YedZ
VVTAAVTKRAPPLSWLQPAVLTGSFAPFMVLVYRSVNGELGANPIAAALNQLGLLGLTFLWACLACTPLKILTGKGWPLRLRKTLGLFAFWTLLLHFSTYAVLDQGLRIGAVLRDVTKRPFIAVGFIGFALLIPLALTSFKDSLRKLGFKTWKRLHRLVYVTAVLGSIHFVMRVKADTREPYLWAAALGVLFAIRLIDSSRDALKSKQKSRLAAGS